MTAGVEDGGEFFRLLFGSIQVAGDVEAGAALEVEFIDDDIFALDGAGDGGVQRRFLWQRREAEHVEIFLTKAWEF